MSLKKLIAPVVIGGVLLGGVAAGGAAYASAPATTTAVATAKVPATTKGHHALRGWLRAHRKEIRRDGVVISAKTIGVTPQVLVADLRSGKSIAEVAQANNVSPQTVVNALVSAADAKVTQAVSDKKLTQAEANKIDAALPGLITKAVDHVFK
jgi:hypothetical protein